MKATPVVVQRLVRRSSLLHEAERTSTGLSCNTIQMIQKPCPSVSWVEPSLDHAIIFSKEDHQHTFLAPPQFSADLPARCGMRGRHTSVRKVARVSPQQGQL